MRGSTPELLTEAILEGYRQTLAGHDHLERTSVIFAEVFDRAVADGKLPADFEVTHVATVAQSLVSEGARLLGGRSIRGPVVREVVGRDIAALVVGYSAPAT